MRARVVAVAADTQLGRLPLARLGELPTACIRHATPDGVLVDLRNLHAPLAGLAPAATVAVVGTRCGADPGLLASILDASRVIPHDDAELAITWQASADAVVFDVPPARAAALERVLHERLLENPA